MDCPRCSKREFETFRIGAVEIDQCASCHGVWLDADELFELTRGFREDDEFLTRCVVSGLLPKDHSAAPGRCPRDNKAMSPFDIPCAEPCERTTLDVCPGCLGIWADGNELADLHAIMLVNKRRGFRPVINVPVSPGLLRRVARAVSPLTWLRRVKERTRG